MASATTADTHAIALVRLLHNAGRLRRHLPLAGRIFISRKVAIGVFSGEHKKGACVHRDTGPLLHPA